VFVVDGRWSCCGRRDIENARKSSRVAPGDAMVGPLMDEVKELRVVVYSPHAHRRRAQKLDKQMQGSGLSSGELLFPPSRCWSVQTARPR